MIPIISTALAIADATGLDDWIVKKLKGSDNGAVNLAGKLVEAATEITGEKEGVAALAAASADPDTQAKIRELVLTNEQEFLMAAYGDRKNARRMYKVHNEQADAIADRIMKYNLPYICVALVANVLAVMYLKDNGAVLAAVSSVLGMAIKSLFDERKDVTGFYFGSSMGSKSKDHQGDNPHV